MVHVHVYGKLRRHAAATDPRAASVVQITHCPGDTVRAVVGRVGISLDELGANLFVDGHYADLETPVPDGARVGLFPDDMQLLYKWYFRPERSLDPRGEPRPGETEEGPRP